MREIRVEDPPEPVLNKPLGSGHPIAIRMAPVEYVVPQERCGAPYRGVPDPVELLIAAEDNVINPETSVTTSQGDQLPEGLDSSSMVATAMRLGGEIVDQNDLAKKSD